MHKKVITRLTQFINFRDLVVGLGILVTVLLLYCVRDRTGSLLLEGNFF